MYQFCFLCSLGNILYVFRLMFSSILLLRLSYSVLHFIYLASSPILCFFSSDSFSHLSAALSNLKTEHRNDRFHFVLHYVVHQTSTVAISPHGWFSWNVPVLFPLVAKSSCRNQRPSLSSLFLNCKSSVTTKGNNKIVLRDIGYKSCYAVKILHICCATTEGNVWRVNGPLFFSAE